MRCRTSSRRPVARRTRPRSAGLTDGSSYTYYVRCSDVAANADASDYAIAFAVAKPADTTPPVRSAGSPSGTLAAGTTQTTLSLVTDEAATCRYGTAPNVAYGALPNVFATTGSTSHSTAVSGLTDGSSYTYYVRCSDTAANADASDYAIAFAVAQAPSTLRAAYALNETSGSTAADASANGNTGSVASASWTTTAKFNGALSFNGTSTVVTVGSRASLDLATTGTLEVWVRLNTLNRWNGVVAKGNVNNDARHNYAIEVDPSNLVNCEVGNGTTFNLVKSAAALTSGQFYHVACTWDGSQLRLYINGVLSRSTAQTLTPTANTAPLYLGQYRRRRRPPRRHSRRSPHLRVGADTGADPGRHGHAARRGGPGHHAAGPCQWTAVRCAAVGNDSGNAGADDERERDVPLRHDGRNVLRRASVSVRDHRRHVAQLAGDGPDQWRHLHLLRPLHRWGG